MSKDEFVTKWDVVRLRGLGILFEAPGWSDFTYYCYQDGEDYVIKYFEERGYSYECYRGDEEGYYSKLDIYAGIRLADSERNPGYFRY